MKTIKCLVVGFALAALLVAGSGCRGGRVPTGLFKAPAKPVIPTKPLGSAPGGRPGMPGGGAFGGNPGPGPMPRPDLGRSIPKHAPAGERISLIVVARQRPAAGTAEPVARVAEVADDVPLGSVDFKKALASIDDALPRATDAHAHAELLLSRRLIASAQRCAEWKQALAGSHHGIESQIEHLPEPVQRPIRAWLGLCETCESLAAPWGQKPPDVARLADALRDVNRVNPQLSGRLQVALVNKATAEGKPDVVRRLRDVKLDAAEAEAAAPVAAGRPDLLPLPEPPAGSQAGQRTSPFRGLAALDDEARGQARQVYTQAVRQAERFGDYQYALGRHLAHHAPRLTSRVTEKKEDREQARRRDQRLFAEVERGLKRALRPSERLIVADMRGQPAAAIIKTIAALD